MKDNIIVEPGKEGLVKCVAGHAFRGLDYTFLLYEPVRPRCCIVKV